MAVIPLICLGNPWSNGTPRSLLFKIQLRLRLIFIFILRLVDFPMEAPGIFSRHGDRHGVFGIAVALNAEVLFLDCLEAEFKISDRPLAYPALMGTFKVGN